MNARDSRNGRGQSATPWKLAASALLAAGECFDDVVVGSGRSMVTLSGELPSYRLAQDAVDLAAAAAGCLVVNHIHVAAS
jgi:hypothetical protein